MHILCNYRTPKKNTRISIKDKMYTFIKENYDIKELGISFTYLKNEQMTYIRNFEKNEDKNCKLRYTRNVHVFYLKRIISLQLDESQWTFYNHNEPIQLNR